MATIIMTDYTEAIKVLSDSRDTIHRELDKLTDGDARRYSREASDLFISISEVIGQLIEDQKTIEEVK